MKVTVVIPTYNERDNIERLVKAILSHGTCFNVLIVDDNSPDGTGEKADHLSQGDQRVSVLHRSAKQGLGSAYREGFKSALEAGADFIIEMDADFSHDPAILPLFIDMMSKYDVVIGSRYINGVSVVNWPIRRLILSYGANVYTRLITGLKISDCTSGFKCFRRDVFKSVDLTGIKSDGYSFQIEMNYRCIEKGFSVGELPIIFIDRHSGTSKMSKKIVREAIFMVWKLRIFSLLGKLFRLGGKSVNGKLDANM